MKNTNKDGALIALQQPEAKHSICTAHKNSVSTDSATAIDRVEVNERSVSVVQLYLLIIYIYIRVPLYGG